MEPKNITVEYIGNFFKLPPEEAQRVFNELERIEYSNAENIVTAGDAADGMYFIEDGKVKVISPTGETVNAMKEGQYFGEYAVIADEPRMSTCRAHGRVVAYRLSSEVLLAEISKNPKIVGDLLKQVYGQVSIKHSKLLKAARKKRGILEPPRSKTREELKTLIITYAAVLAVFVLVGIFAPDPGNIGVGWIAVPIVFFLVHNICTRRTLETLILTIALCCGIAGGGNYLQGFFDCITDGITARDNATTVLIMALMGSATALLDAAGGISAFRRPAERRIKTRTGAFFAMLGMLILIFIDDVLNLLSASFCLVGIMDKQKTPREYPALIGTSATAICSLIPVSVWGAYLSGTIQVAVGEGGGKAFLQSIGFNYASLFALIGTLLLCAGMFPKGKILKAADERVKNGGTLWPEGSEKYFLAEDDSEIYGSVHDLVIPLISLVVFSVVFGFIRNGGSFGLDAGTGLVATLVVMFVLYCGERLIRPEKFFDSMITGVQSSVMPILLLLLTVCFSSCLQKLNYTTYIVGEIGDIVGGFSFMLPAVLYVIFGLLTMLIGSSWGMYGIGIPVAVSIAVPLGISVPLCIGAVCAAGITGDNLSPYLLEGSVLVSAVGCEPHTARKLRLKYWGVIAIVSFIGYVIAGLLLA